jgi:Type-IV b secretion system, inner-membrane complex component
VKNSPQPPRAKGAPAKPAQMPRPVGKTPGPGAKAAPQQVRPPQQAAAKGTVPLKPPPVKKTGFLGIDPVPVDVVNEQAAKSNFKRAAGLVNFQTTIITVLAGILVFGQPFFQPVYEYYTVDGQSVTQIIGLPMPNMTNRAVLSWAESSITEVMTIGFGDFAHKLINQRSRFTSDGWDAFVASFLNQGIDATFRRDQLVLTTIPTGPAQIDQQGPNEKDVYQWRVSMPVVMTYATNNNVTNRERATINLTIVRDRDNPNGIAIETWSKS